VLKLYKRVDGRLHYREAWVEDGNVVEHWGPVGERGEDRTSPAPKGKREATLVKQALQGAITEGYAQVDDDDHRTLLVEYAIDGFGSDADLDKRRALQDRLNDTLGWTGLGHCDGGSSGSGTMEACCFVVDFELARRVIAADLAGTPFADYTRIYDEDAE
jgi:hypothetical protein